MTRMLNLFVLAIFIGPAAAQDSWVAYKGGDGPGKGKKIVLVSGDEEYRSEEMLPQLGKILAQRHGFDCTVLFAIDKDGTINPTVTNNIPGLEALKDAGLLVLFTRYRNLPDEQMKLLIDYVDSGRPIVGLRTATHAFNGIKSKDYSKYNANGDKTYKGGFGRQVLGETWVNHHGKHGSEATRGVIVKGAENHPILKGIKYGDIFGPTDVYTVKLPEDCTPLVMGEVVAGMKATDPPVIGKKNDPMMPIAWTRLHKAGGKEARVFTTTLASSQDFLSEGTRRMTVNAVFWALGLDDRIPERTNVDLVGAYEPLPFKFNGHRKGLRPADLQ
jgi:hypothetical protein